MQKNGRKIDPITLYKHISREISDKFWLNYSQFDLYAGQTIFFLKHIFIGYMRLIRPYKSFEDILKMSILDNFWTYFFNSTNTRSTYTRVYSVMKYWNNNNLKYLTRTQTEKFAFNRDLHHKMLRTTPNHVFLRAT